MSMSDPPTQGASPRAQGPSAAGLPFGTSPLSRVFPRCAIDNGHPASVKVLLIRPAMAPGGDSTITE
jgi:hypothetical protein